MKKFAAFVLVIAGLTAVYYYFAREEENLDVSEIRSLLNRQTACWNLGNVECFMMGYWESDSLIFIGRSGITYGYQNTLEGYKERYSDKSAMGELKFDIMEMRKISDEVYLVVGKFYLERESLEDIEGIFTLTLKKIKDKWVIVADHTTG
jgi:hypothetical protein